MNFRLKIGGIVIQGQGKFTPPCKENEMPTTISEFTVATNDTSVGYGEFSSPAWVNPDKALANETDYAHVGVDSETDSNYLKLAKPATLVPTTATITGVAFEILASVDTVPLGANFTKLRAVVGGEVIGDDLVANPAQPNDVYFHGGPTLYVYGGLGNLLGLSLTPENLNADNAGVVLQCAAAGGIEARIHRIRRIVYHT